MQQPMPNPNDITDSTIVMNMTLALMAKAFKLNYSTPTNNNQRISSNPRNRQIAQPGNLNGYNVVQNVGNQVAQNPRIQNDGNQNQIGNEECDLMAAAADLDEIEEVNANCILMANLQQASSSGTQTDSTPVYDTDGSAEVHENYDNNEIFNMFTQEEQYTELLEPIPEPQQVPQNDNNVISEATNVEQGGETVEQHSANFEETRALYESLYQNLAVEVEKVNSGLVEVEERAYLVVKRKMIPEPGANRKVTITETFHLQTDDELFDKGLKQIKTDDQAIQTILLGLPEDIYAAVDSCETAQEIWLRVQQKMKGSDIGIQEKKAKNKHFPEKIASNLKFLNNLQPEWSRHKEVDKLKAERITKTQDPLALMANSNNPYAFSAPHQDQSSFNQNYLQQPMPNPKDITDSTTAMNMALALMAKAFKLNYSTPTNNNQRISSNPRNRQIAKPGLNMGQDRQMQMVGGNGNQNQIGNGNLVAARAEGNAAGKNGNQIRCYNCRGVAAADLDEIKEVNANCILMANLQQASTSGTQTYSAPVYDTDGSAEVHKNCDNNEIFNMFTQEEHYTELLEPIPESHQVPHNDNDVISKDTSVE
nr:hypothetical protein [Tanacetum cinerariifolium]